MDMSFVMPVCICTAPQACLDSTFLICDEDSRCSQKVLFAHHRTTEGRRRIL